MPSTEHDFLEILRILHKHRVEFVLVGGVAAVAQGAPLITQDVDVVHSRNAENLQRILSALDELEAHYRHRPEMRPSTSHLASAGHQLLITKHGPLDLLGAIGASHEYPELHEHSTQVKVASDLTIAVLDLPWLIKVKEESPGEKDLPQLPVLRRTLEERNRR